MKVVFVSNFFNHHQKPLCDAFFKNKDIDFMFVETETMSDERKLMGYGMELPHYVHKCGINKKYDKEIQHNINNADVVIYGCADYSYIRKRLLLKKTTFWYTERLYKKFGSKEITFKNRISMHLRFNFKHLFVLCAGSFVSYDLSCLRILANKTFKWGYFPETIILDTESCIKQKKENSIICVSRFIEWKHLENIIFLADFLVKKRYSFHITIVGTGELESELRTLTQQKDLDNYISFIGCLSPIEVRKKMIESQILIVTSDRNEGWGAVINEGMNSCCSVVVGDEVGASSYLINNLVNGVIYHNKDLNSFYKSVQMLFDDKELSNSIAKNAYKTIVEKWNAEIAADRFYKIAKEIITNNTFSFYPDGICSIANVEYDI